MPSVVIGKVKGEQGEAGFSPVVEMTKTDDTLTISITDQEGLKTQSISTGENVQGDWNVTDTASGAYIWNKPTIPSSEILSEEQPVNQVTGDIWMKKIN
jgi:hypothetical protein